MPIQRPTVDQLRNKGLNYFRVNAGVANSVRYESTFLFPFFSAIAVMADLLLTFIERLYLDRWITTASEEALIRYHLPLTRVQRIDAAFAIGTITFTGADGVNIPINTFVTSDSGLRFKTTATGAIASGSVVLSAEAENTGASYNIENLSTMFLETIISGVDATATSSAFTGGLDLEPLDSWRSRMINSISDRLGAGSKLDIEGWIQDALGDVKGFAFGRYPANGAVTITYVNQDPDDILPTSGGLATALNFVNERVSLGADVQTLTPIAYPMDYIIKIDPNTTEQQNAILASLKEFYMLNSQPSLITAASPSLFSLSLSKIREAISIAAGEARHDITALRHSGVNIEAEEIEIPDGELAVLGTVTFEGY